METGDKTAEHLEMAAGKEGNRTLAADDIVGVYPKCTVFASGMS
jgi:hypothetical protein